MDIKERNRQVIEQFRAGGPTEGMDRDRLLLLTTTGSRSGRPHTAPMTFHRDGHRLLVIASYAGAPQHPAWYTNLVADPRVTVEIGDETYEARATPAGREERERLWQVLLERFPFLAEHQARTERVIPVVVLERV
jgi:deazaflavin-dependent oxidoreductase (nitroreductase family)